MNEPAKATGLVQVESAPFPPAPILEHAIGYQGEARWLATWWEPSGDECWFTDGRYGTNGDWLCWLNYFRNDRVAAALYAAYKAQSEHTGWDFGSSDSPATHAYVLDLLERKLYVAPVRVAQRFVDSQWGEPLDTEPVVLDEGQLNELILGLAKEFQEIQVSPKDLMEAMRERDRRSIALNNWLNHKN